MIQSRSWAASNGKYLSEVVDGLWLEAIEATLKDHSVLLRWREMRERRLSLAPPPSDSMLRLLLKPVWWESFDAATVTAIPVAQGLDPARTYLGSPNLQMRRVLPKILDEIERLRPNVFTHAVFDLVQAISTGELKVSGVADLAVYPDGQRRGLPIEMLRARKWIFWRNGSITIQHHPEGQRHLYAEARLKSFVLDSAMSEVDPSIARVPDNDALVACMITEGHRILSTTGQKPKRADLIQHCVSRMKCRNKDAEAAHLRLPEDIRRSRGNRYATRVE